MKILTTITAGILILFTSTCSNTSGDNSALMEVTGTVEASGITSYQYGTHTLTSSEKKYALKSTNIDLSDYEGETVKISGEKIEGYPVENGPEYLDVQKIEREK
ncbi:hypothetical protein RM549_13500 [Salegentibacter sp. F188]|uniref:DUF3221 domain-containing protein n=1 Tax=Autumnicola patrickiae TaxID=3075591 RepID=A0ABU3E4H5_9FLAO|nr:hypothetical protein [Salegentibacter sp. F188]MDT0690808.1 hypothetical protein [Salegentibacter sp. F188]